MESTELHPHYLFKQGISKLLGCPGGFCHAVLLPQLLFDKDAKKIHEKRENAPLNGIEKTGYPHKDQKLDPYSTTCIKINSKSTNDLNIIRETVKLLEENTGEKLPDIGLSGQ